MSSDSRLKFCPVLSRFALETTSETSSSVENGMSGFELRWSKLNAFHEESQIQALGKPWLE